MCYNCENCKYNHFPRLNSIDIQPCDILVIGDIPIAKEVYNNKVMQGPGRQIMDKAFKQVGINKKIHYITAVCCAIPKKGKIGTDILNCHDVLIDTIHACNPQAILVLGKTAYQVVTERTNDKITEKYGRFLEVPQIDVPIMAVTNPGLVIRSPNEYKPLIQMLLKFKQVVFGDDLYDSGETTWTVLQTDEDFDKFLQFCEDTNFPEKHLWGADIETTDLDYRYAEFCVLGLSYEKNKSFVIARSLRERVREFWSLAKRKKWRIVWQHGKYDKKVLWRRNLGIVDIDEDTLYQHYLLDETSAHDLGYLTKVYINAEEYKYKMNQNFKAVTLETYDSFFDALCERVAVDADYTRQVSIVLNEQLSKPENKALKYLYDTLMIPVANFLSRVEQNGVLIDEKFLKDLDAVYQQRIEDILKEIQYEARYDWDPEQYKRDTGAKSAQAVFNPGSPKQMSWMVFNKLGLKPRVRRGNSSSEEVLTSIENPPKIIELVLKYRGVKKEHSTYVLGLLKRRDIDGKVRANFNPAGTATGRLSCKEPNLQNLPATNGVGNIRRSVLAPKGYVLAEIDYSGAELRWLAVLSKDKVLTRIFQEGVNLHDETARLMFGDNFTKADRMKAKTVNFGIVYGRQAKSLADMFDIPLDEAQSIIDKWLGAYPQAKEYLDWCVNTVKRGGYIQSPFGNRRRFGCVSPASFDSLCNEAKNFAIQNASSQLLLLCCLTIEDELRSRGVTIINLIHDSVLIQCPDDPETVHWACNLVGETMISMPKKVFNTEVPFAYDVDMGFDWGTLSAYDVNTQTLEVKEDGEKKIISYKEWHDKYQPKDKYEEDWYKQAMSVHLPDIV